MQPLVTAQWLHFCFIAANASILIEFNGLTITLSTVVEMHKSTVVLNSEKNKV